MNDQLSNDLASLQIDRSAAPSAGSGRRILVGVVLLVAVVGLGFWAKPLIEGAFFATEVEFTEVARMSPAQAAVDLTATGYVIPQTTSKVSVKVGGKISKVHVKQGQVVKAGDPLFELDPSDQDAAIAAASAQVQAATARVAAARANLLETQQVANRELALSSAGVGTRGAAEDTAARVTAMAEQVKAAEADTKAARAQMGAMQVNRGNYIITAPVSGTIVTKPPELGEFLGPQPAGLAVDMGGVEIADFATLMVETDVPEAKLGMIKMGGPAEIVLDAYAQKRFRGKAVEVTPKVNRTKATVVVKVAFVDDMAGVLPEMSARVSFLAKELDAAQLKQAPKLVVTSNAVATVAGAKVVWTVEGDVVRQVPVELGPALGGGFELLKGPAAGTKLIKSPPAILKDGQKVKEKKG